MNSNKNTQLLIIGAGPGGYSAAFLAAKLGIKVTLVDENENPGGICLYQGCIPSKALLHTAKVITDALDAEDIGIKFGQPDIDLNKLRDWKNSVISRLSIGLQSLCRQKKIDFIKGRASFTSSKSVKIAGHGTGPEEVTFEHAIIATGCKSVKLPFSGESKRIMDSRSALEIESIPEKLLIIGGGYIGLELGTVYSGLGSRVSVVEMLPSLLAEVDPDLTRILEKRLKTTFESIRTGIKVTNIKEAENGIVTGLEDKSVNMLSEKYDKVLVAIGRAPSTEGLGLNNTGVTLNDKGFIKIDACCRTDDNKIYAIGDIAGNPLLAHKAMAQAPVAVNAIAGRDTQHLAEIIPAVIFTDPEIAWCGLSKKEAESKGLTPRVTKYIWSASGRATTMNRTDGMTKLVVDADTDKILGLGIVGVDAGELISEGVLAIEKGATAKDLAKTVHPHPTLSEILKDTADRIDTA